MHLSLPLIITLFVLFLASTLTLSAANFFGVELFFDNSGGSLLQHKSGGGDIDHHVLSSSRHLSASYILALYSDPLLHFQNGFRNPLAETTQILG